MSVVTEPCLQLLNRAYCYLRFSGLDEAAACQHLHALVELHAGVAGDDDERRDRLWQLVMERAAETPDAHPGTLPPLLRGHIRYVDAGR